MVFCDFYLPGFKSGGGMWTIVNLVERFYERYDFYVVTRNYDSKGDQTPYTTVRTDDWNRTGNANVYYLSPQSLTAKKFAELVNEIKPDAVYLNSVFSRPVMRFLTARRKKLIRSVPVILAPCGELSENARSFRKYRKMVYLPAAKFYGLYKDILWKASFETEADEIRSVFGEKVEIMTAPDLAPKSILPDLSLDQKPEKSVGSVKMIFLSRVVPKKNPKFLLECLLEITEGNVELKIVGPREESEYWNECLDIISRLPKNIRVDPVGPVPYTEGLEHLASSHFFVMPTLNENFGYVFLEALAAGCGLVISDQTVWNDLEEREVGWSISLKTKDKWVARLRHCINMNSDEFLALSRGCREYAGTWLAKPEIEEATAKVLERAMNG